MMNDDDAQNWITAVNTLAPGFRNTGEERSDRPVIRLKGAEGEKVLRAWPTGTKPSTIEDMSAALTAMSDASGGKIPAMTSAVINGQIFTCQTFLPGLPLGRYGGYSDPDSNAINLPLPESADVFELAAHIAQLLAVAHEASVPVAKNSHLPAQTLGAFLADVRKNWFDAKKVIGDRAASQRDIRRWLRCGNRIIPTASDILRNAPAELHDTSVMGHLDLWPVHVLVNQETVSGLVGWRHMAPTSPVRDLAALATHLQGWSAAMTEHLIEHYSIARRLKPQERRLVASVAALDLVEQVRRLLVINYLDDRMIDHPALPVAKSGLKTLLNSLETLTSMLAPDIEQTKRFAQSRTFSPDTKATGPARPRQARIRPSNQRPNRPIRQRKQDQ